MFKTETVAFWACIFEDRHTRLIQSNHTLSRHIRLKQSGYTLSRHILNQKSGCTLSGQTRSELNSRTLR